MEELSMHLKILLPYEIFADVKGVKRIVVDTTAGSHGILPRRLDCAAALQAGILLYETDEGEKYVAINEGILIKTGQEVLVSVRNAIGDAPLGELKKMVREEMLALDELEVDARTVMAKLETGFLQSFQKLRN